MTGPPSTVMQGPFTISRLFTRLWSRLPLPSASHREPQREVQESEAQHRPDLLAPYYDRQGSVMFIIGGLLVAVDLAVTRAVHDRLGEGFAQAATDAVLIALAGASRGSASAAARAGDDLRSGLPLPLRRSWLLVAVGGSAGAALSLTVTTLLRG